MKTRTDNLTNNTNETTPDLTFAELYMRDKKAKEYSAKVEAERRAKAERRAARERRERIQEILTLTVLPPIMLALLWVNCLWFGIL